MQAFFVGRAEHDGLSASGCPEQTCYSAGTGMVEGVLIARLDRAQRTLLSSLTHSNFERGENVSVEPERQAVAANARRPFTTGEVRGSNSSDQSVDLP